MRIYFKLIYLLLIISPFIVLKSLSKEYQRLSKEQEQMRVQKDAELCSLIVDYYYKAKNPVRFKTIHEALRQIRINLDTHLPGSPYTEKDLVAIIMIESSFNQYAVGPKNEKGLFQLTDQAAKDLGIKQNQFDIAVNTEMAVKHLKTKYDIYKDYKKGLIAYNGVVPTEKGWSEKYWKRFSKARKTVDHIYKDWETSCAPLEQ